MRKRDQDLSTRARPVFRCGPGICFLLIPLLAGGLLYPVIGFSADKEKAVTWKPIKEALLRVNDQAVKNWNVYDQNRKGDPLLLEIGNRLLLIQVHERKVFELSVANVEHKGTELVWDPPALPAEPLPSSDWLIKDVGFAYRIDFQLVSEKRLVDLQLPHPMDLRYL